MNPQTHFIKRAAVRGIAHELIRAGVAQFPSKEAADAAADALADAPEMDALPDTSGEEGHHPEDIAAVGAKLIEMGQQLMAEAHAAGHGEEVLNKAASELTKTASAESYEDVASKEAAAVMQKIAAERKEAEALAGEPGTPDNTVGEAAKTDSTARGENAKRPEGYAAAPEGQTDLKSTDAQTGKQEKKDHSGAVSGENSVTADAQKSAAYSLWKQAASKLVGVGPVHENTLANAAKTDDAAKLEQQNRPDGKYEVPEGKTELSTAGAATGDEKDTKGKLRVDGSNSAVAATKVSEEDAFRVLFQKTAEDVSYALPKNFSDTEKAASISKMIGMTRVERQQYINILHGAK